MTHPQRIQRQRTKGYRQPEGTIYCGRPTKWGNPFQVKETNRGFVVTNGLVSIEYDIERYARRGACNLFRAYLLNDGSQPGQIRDAGGAFILQLAREQLRKAKYLSCWCPLDMPCHVDVIIELLKEQG